MKEKHGCFIGGGPGRGGGGGGGFGAENIAQHKNWQNIQSSDLLIYKSFYQHRAWQIICCKTFDAVRLRYPK